MYMVVSVFSRLVAFRSKGCRPSTGPTRPQPQLFPPLSASSSSQVAMLLIEPSRALIVSNMPAIQSLSSEWTLRAWIPDGKQV